MKRKVLVESTIETDDTGKYCVGTCKYKIYADYCDLFSTGLNYNYEITKYKRCVKCLKAEVKP